MNKLLQSPGSFLSPCLTRAAGHNLPAEWPVRTSLRDWLLSLSQSRNLLDIGTFDASDLQVLAEARIRLETVAPFDEYRPDIVLLDIRTPGVTGIEAARLNPPGRRATCSGSRPALAARSG